MLTFTRRYPVSAGLAAKLDDEKVAAMERHLNARWAEFWPQMMQSLNEELDRQFGRTPAT